MGPNQIDLHKIVSNFTSHGKISVDKLPGVSSGEVYITANIIKKLRINRGHAI
jgi:hypothetical protein